MKVKANGITFNCTVNGPTPVTGSQISCGSTTTLDLSGAGRDGDYTLSVTATDAAGNTSIAGSASYVLDTTAPPAPTVLAPASPAQSRSSTGMPCAVAWMPTVSRPIPATRGRRPVATSSRSPRTC